MEALHQSMMNFCQTATTALQEQQKLAAEMREALVKIQAHFPDQLAPRGEVGGRLSPTPTPRDTEQETLTPEGRGGCPENCQCMGVRGLCGPDGYASPQSRIGIRMELVAKNQTLHHPASLTPREDKDEDEGGYSTDGYTPRSDDEDLDHKAQVCFDKYTARWGVTHGGHTINYDEPVYTRGGGGLLMPRGVFQDSGWGGWGDDIVVGDIVRTFPLGGICDKTKQYGIVTQLKKGETKRLDAFVVDIIMFIPEMERELNSRLESPITGMCGYKIGLQKTFGAQRRMAKLV